MKNFLFVQWKKPTDQSRFVIDGRVSEYAGSEEQNKLMKMLAKIPECKEVGSKKDRSDLSPSFRCSFMNANKSSLKFVEGNFMEKDCTGRQMVYIFATYENDSNTIAHTLEEYAALLGVTPYAADLQVIKKNIFINQSNNKTLWIIIAIILVILALLFILLNLQSKQ